MAAACLAIASTTALNSSHVIASTPPLLSVPLLDASVLAIHKYIALVVLCALYIATHIPSTAVLLSKSFSRPPSAPTATPKHHGLPQEIPLPHVFSAIPLLGHVMALRQRGGRYVYDLIRKTPAELFTITVLRRRVLVAAPSVDRALGRHVHETSLAQVVSLIGRQSLGLGEGGARAIAEHDPRPVHRSLFSAADGISALNDTASEFVRRRIDALPDRQHVGLGRFVFDLVVGAAAHSLWGPENPWTCDAEFLEQFIIVSDRFETLGQPMAWLTAAKAYRAREFLISRLKAFHATHRSSRAHSVAHRINAVAMGDAQWESNDDYYRVELLEALGLLATASTLSVWLVRELLARPDLFAAVVREVRDAEDSSANDSCADDDSSAKDASAQRHASSQRHPSAQRPSVLNPSAIRASCPTLIAAWYETLRLHMTLVPRVASQPFSLDIPSRPGAPVQIRQHDIILMPMLAFNLDVAAWGPDAADFNPARFLDAHGQVVAQRTRRVRGFGVAGNLCPGRVFGFDVALACVSTVLRAFDVETKPYARPTPMAGTNVGFERVADEVHGELRRVVEP